MVKRKSIRTRGKLKLSSYFQKFEKGERVAVIKERTLTKNFPERIQGSTGIVEGKRGRSYVIKLKDQAKEKEFIIAPIHLKKIKTE